MHLLERHTDNHSVTKSLAAWGMVGCALSPDNRWNPVGTRLESVLGREASTHSASRLAGFSWQFCQACTIHSCRSVAWIHSGHRSWLILALRVTAEYWDVEIKLKRTSVAKRQSVPTKISRVSSWIEQSTTENITGTRKEDTRPRGEVKHWLKFSSQQMQVPIKSQSYSTRPNFMQVQALSKF